MQRHPSTNAILIAICALGAALLSGCASGKHSTPDPVQVHQPAPQQSMVVFLRPSVFGGAISSSVFENVGPNEKLIGILGPNEKVAYKCQPGEHQFMVISENADFIQADLAAGKTYYVIITPRMGMWKARFSLHPFKVNPAEDEFNINSDDLKDWLSECEFVQPAPSAHQWATTNAASISEKRFDYWPDWLEKSPEEQRAYSLEPQDGVSTPLDKHGDD